MSGPIALLRRPAVAGLVDVALVLAFAAIGRATHAESNPVIGALTTAWPFLVGTVAGWTIVRSLGRRWPVEAGPGVTVWFVTVALGMLLRRLSGQGTALTFVLVAALTLGVLLIGWRALRDRATARAAHREAVPETRSAGP